MAAAPHPIEVACPARTLAPTCLRLIAQAEALLRRERFRSLGRDQLETASQAARVHRAGPGHRPST
jgi:hypothetical protein